MVAIMKIPFMPIWRATRSFWSTVINSDLLLTLDNRTASLGDEGSPAFSSPVKNVNLYNAAELLMGPC